MINKQTTKEHLVKYGIKPSTQRVAIMQFLLSHPIHPTVDDIYVALLPQYPNLSKTTVYNTLHLFVNSHAALRLWINEQCTRYDGDVSKHAHFACQSCGKIIDIPLPAVSQDLAYPAALEGAKVAQVEVYYKGYCRMCNERINTVRN